MSRGLEGRVGTWCLNYASKTGPSGNSGEAADANKGSGGLPGISARTRLRGVVGTPGPDPSLQAAWHQYRVVRKPRKCRCFFGLARLRVHQLWRVTPTAVGPCPGRPHDVEL